MTKENYLTPTGYRQLTQELESLKKTKRAEIAEKIKTAKDFGDITENAEYADAKNEQAFVEGRILEIEKILGKAKIIKKGKKKTAALGSKITLKNNTPRSKSKTSQYILVGHHEANPSQGMISINSPLGQELHHKKRGDKIVLKTPAGKREYQVLKIE